MSEMALTADHVVVVGRGRLIADVSVAELTAQSSGRYVRVRSPGAAALRERLVAAGGLVQAGADGALEVRNLREEQIGEIAAATGTVLHELAPREASLEEAYLELTESSAEYRGHAAVPGDATVPSSTR